MEDFLAELGEGCVVGTLGFVEDSQDSANSFALELVKDSIEISGLGFPKFNFRHGSWINMCEENTFGILLEDILNLLRPGDDGTFKGVNLNAAFGIAWVKSFLLGPSRVGKGEAGDALNMALSDLYVGDEYVKSLTDILGDSFRPSLGGRFAGNDGVVNSLCESSHVFDGVCSNISIDYFSHVVFLCDVSLLKLHDIKE